MLKHKQSTDPLIEWAKSHMNEWEIICGIRTTGIRNNMNILDTLKKAGFNELSNMMACRIYQYIYDDSSKNKDEKH